MEVTPQETPRFWRPRTRLVPKPAEVPLRIMEGSAIDREVGVTHNPPRPADDGSPYPISDRGRWVPTDVEAELPVRAVKLELYKLRSEANARLHDLRARKAVVWASLYHTPNDRPQPWAIKWGRDLIPPVEARSEFPMPEPTPFHLIRSHPPGLSLPKSPVDARMTFRRAIRAKAYFEREVAHGVRWARWFTLGRQHVVETGREIDRRVLIAKIARDAAEISVASIKNQMIHEAETRVMARLDDIKNAPRGF